jgi:hypothetical protein
VIGGLCSTHEREEKCVQKFYWKIQEMRTFRRSKRRCEDNIKLNLREIRCGLDSSGSG